MKSIVLSLTVVSEDRDRALKAWEAIGRLAMGLGLDDITCTTTVGVVETEDDDETADDR